MASCPSGCPRGTFPREPVIFDRPTPHIVVAWDGDKIDYVPIPPPQGGFSQGVPLRLTSDEVVDLIRNFLSSKDFALPGLFMRIHYRDAMTEYDFCSAFAWIRLETDVVFELYQNRGIHSIDSRLHMSHLNTRSPDALSFPNFPKSDCIITFVISVEQAWFPRRFAYIPMPDHRLWVYSPSRPLLLRDRLSRSHHFCRFVRR
jgi:hypothetical protein